MNWLRLYHSVLDDPKVQRLSAPDFKFWINILICASANNPRGVLPSVDDLAFKLHSTSKVVEKQLESSLKVGLVEFENGFYKIHNWDQRQFASDNINERVARHRAKDRNVTGNVSKALHVTPSDTDTDTDTEKNPLPPCALSRTDGEGEPDEANFNVVASLQLVSPETPEQKARRKKQFLDESHEQFYSGYWRKVAKPRSRKAWAGAIVKVTKEKNVTAQEAAQFLTAQMLAQRREMESRGDLEYLEKTHPASWLNREGWNDVLPPPKLTGGPVRAGYNIWAKDL